MADRLVVLIENDPVLSERLRAVLAAYHLRVELIPDGNELTLRRDLDPVLIILCIDPKRLGWAICNKIKKSTQYRNVPMVVTSQEATDKDFDDHKKLRTRAEEYLHKPFGVELMLEKVAFLIGLDPPQIDDSGLEEIPIDDASLIEEEILAPAPEPAAAAPAVSPSQHAAYIDQQIADETDAAFAAIGMATEDLRTPIPGNDTLPPSLRRPNLPGVSPRAEMPRPVLQGESPIKAIDDEIELGFEDVVTTGIRRQGPAQGYGGRPTIAALEQQAEQLQRELARVRTDAEHWHEERDRAASERDHLHYEREQLQSEVQRLTEERERAAAQRAEDSVATDRSRDEQQRLALERDQLLSERDKAALERDQARGEATRLREERDRLKTESDELRTRPTTGAPAAAAGSSFSRERELLGLREVINKKEKEILDLRDSLDSKERQILDARDKARELERTRRDLDEKLLEIEKEHVAAREKIEALVHDKEIGLERERGLKARLDDAQRKLQRADEEVEGWKRRYAADLQRAEEALAQAQAQHQQAIAAQLARHGEQVQGLRAEHAALLEGLRAEHAAAQDGLRSAHEEAQRQKEEEQRAQVAALLEGHARTLAERNAEAEAALAEQQRLHEQAVAALKGEHAADKAELSARHAEDLRGAQERHREALAEAEAQKQAELQQRAAEHAAAHNAQAEEHRRRTEVLEGEHREKVAALQLAHRQEMDHLTQVLTGERDAVAERLAEREADQAQLRTRLAETEANLAGLRQRHTETSAQLDRTQADLADREQRLGDVGSENAAFQEQLLRAYQRIKSDEGLVSRAKKALAIALTLLDESGAPVPQSPTTPPTSEE